MPEQAEKAYEKEVAIEQEAAEKKTRRKLVVSAVILLLLIGGGSGHGFKHGPAVGEYVAARLTGSATPAVEARFSLASKGTEQNRSVV